MGGRCVSILSRGWVTGAAVGTVALVAGTTVALRHLSHAGWVMTGWQTAASYAQAVALGSGLGAALGTVADWAERLRERQRPAGGTVAGRVGTTEPGERRA
jgi:hypothetical protein